MNDFIHRFEPAKDKLRTFFLSMTILRTSACAAVFSTLVLTGCGGGASSPGTIPQPSLAATRTTLTAAPASVAFGAPIMLTATVMYPPAEAASGTVTFIDGMASLGSSILDPNGVGSLKVTTLAVGTHTITARFAATSTLAASTSAAFTVTVTAPTVTKIDTATTHRILFS